MKVGVRATMRRVGGRLTVFLWVWVCLALGGWTAIGAAIGDRNSVVLGAERELLERMGREGTNIVSLYALGDVCHDAGVSGDKEAVVRAEVYLRRLLDLDPTNAPALALLGSVYTMKGRDAFWPTTQLRLVREGNAYMDKAVAWAPEDLRTRMTRAFNNAHMPDFLGRNATVTADLEWLWGWVEKAPGRFTVHQRQELALHWGRRLKRQNRIEEARRVWESGRTNAVDSQLAQELATELSRSR